MAVSILSNTKPVLVGYALKFSKIPASKSSCNTSGKPDNKSFTSSNSSSVKFFVGTVPFLYEAINSSGHKQSKFDNL